MYAKFRQSSVFEVFQFLFVFRIIYKWTRRGANGSKINILNALSGKSAAPIVKITIRSFKDELEIMFVSALEMHKITLNIKHTRF